MRVQCSAFGFNCIRDTINTDGTINRTVYRYGKLGKIEADMDQDGFVNGLDMAPFTAAVLGVQKILLSPGLP